MLRKALAVLSLCLVALSPNSASAAISYTQLFAHSATTSTTNQGTVGATCAVGNTLVLFAAGQAATTLSSVADSGGNTWQTPIDNLAGTSTSIAVAFAYNTTAQLTNASSTVTATFSGSTTGTISVACVTGLASTNALDLHNKTNQGTGATAATSTSTGTLSHTNEIAYGVIGNNIGRGTLTCGTGWTLAGTLGSSSTPSIGVCSQIVSSTTSLTWSPTWVTSSNYVVDIVTFSDTATGGAVTPKGTLMGVLP